MKKWILSMMILLLMSGCGSSLANFGGGAAAGGALSQTIVGLEADLDRQEQYLIELYNQGVEMGAEQQELDQIKQEIYDTRLGKQTIEAGKELLGIDWKDPKEAGGAIGLIATLAYGVFKRRELAQVAKKYTASKKGTEKFMREHNAEGAILYKDIGAERAKLKV